MLDDLISSDKLAELLGKSKRTLKRYEDAPDGLPHIRLGGQKLYRLSSVKRWIEDRETWPNRRRGTAA